MESAIVRNLRPEFEPVAVVWSNTIPQDTLQFKNDKFGCVLYLFAQADQAAPRTVLGMLGVDGRKVMHKRFRDDILTLTLPTPLFQRMEQEANDCVFQTPSWKDLIDGSR
jgi:hypothetical protein